jgi:hypothetical protein
VGAGLGAGGGGGGGGALKGEGVSFSDAGDAGAEIGVASGWAVFAPPLRAPGLACTATWERPPRTSRTIFGSTRARAIVGSEPLPLPPLPELPEPPEASA